MNKLFTQLVLVFCTLAQVQIVAQVTQSFTTAGSKGWDMLSDIAFDSEGNYYLAGSFSGTLGINSLESAGKRDIFLLKYDLDNNLEWSKQIGGPGDENAYSIVCDAAGNVYLAGAFSNTVEFENSRSATGITDVFVAKYTPGGTLDKSFVLSSPQPAKKTFLQLDAEGNLWIVGSFAKGIGTTAGVLLETESKSDIYAIRYNTSTNQVEGQFKLNNPNPLVLTSFAMDPDNGLYFGGYFEKDIQIGGNTINSIGKNDAFVAKYDTEGNNLWLKTAGGFYNDQASSLALNMDEGSLLVAGEFKNQLQFDGSTTSLSSINSNEAFIAKYAITNGQLLQVKKLGGNAPNYCSTISNGPNNKFYLSGSFRGQLELADASYASKELSKDAFIVRYSSDGVAEQLIRAGGNQEDQLFLSYSPEVQRLYVGGFYSTDFALSNDSVGNSGYKDIYFAALADCNFDLQLDLGPDTTFCQGITYILDAGAGFQSYQWNGVAGESQLTAGATGLYKVIVSDQLNCKQTDSVQVTVNPSPYVNLGEDILATPDSFIYLLANESNQSYQWSDGNTCRILCIPTNSITDTATIWLKVTNEFGCLAFDAVFINKEQAEQPALKFAATTEPIDELSADTEPEIIETPLTYKIYPNPTDGKFFINVSKPEQVKLLVVYNLKGNLVKLFQNNLSFPMQINLEEQSNGVYVVKVVADENSMTIKVVKE